MTTATTLVLPHMLDWPGIRERLAAAMADKKLSQRGLAGEAHISQGGLSMFLSGKSDELDLATLDALAMALDMPVEDLAGLEPAPAGADPTYTHDQLAPWIRNPRKEFDADAIEGLARSIREVGLLEPLLVDPRKDGTAVIVAGERRWRAIRQLIATGDWPEDKPVPARPITEAEEQPLLILALNENMQREDLTPLEEAEAFAQLQGDLGMLTTDIAAAIGKTERHVQYRLKLLELGDAARAALAEGLIPAAAARHIARLEDPKQQQAVVDRIRAGDMAPSEERVRTHVNMILSKPKSEREPDPEQMDIEDLAPRPGAAGAAQASPNEHGIYPPEVCEQIAMPHRVDCSAVIHVVQQENGMWTASHEVSGAFGGAGGYPPHNAARLYADRVEAIREQAGGIARYAAGFLPRADTTTRGLRQARFILAWANETLSLHFGEPVDEPDAYTPPPNFTPPPPEDRLRPHAERPHAGVEALTSPPDAAGEKAYRLEFWSPEGPGGWPASFQIRHRDKGLATYRLERVPQKD